MENRLNRKSCSRIHRIISFDMAVVWAKHVCHVVICFSSLYDNIELAKSDSKVNIKSKFNYTTSELHKSVVTA